MKEDTCQKMVPRGKKYSACGAKAKFSCDAYKLILCARHAKQVQQKGQAVRELPEGKLKSA